MGIVYLITNKMNGKRYVGKTLHSLSRRWSQHRCAAARSTRPTLFHKAIRKYGSDCFSLEVLSGSTDPEEINRLEALHIDAFNSRAPRGYNLTAGGDGLNGFACSPETRKKISDAKGRTMSADKRLRISAGHVGLKHKDSTKEKMRQAKLGKPRSEATKQKIRLARVVHKCKKGHSFSAENTYISPSGKRSCRACKRARRKSYMKKVVANAISHI